MPSVIANAGRTGEFSGREWGRSARGVLRPLILTAREEGHQGAQWLPFPEMQSHCNCTLASKQPDRISKFSGTFKRVALPLIGPNPIWSEATRGYTFAAGHGCPLS
jgi:hypothetical protein